MLVQLDLSTLAFISGLTFVTQSIVLLVQYMVNRTYPGLGWWLLGSTLWALGVIAEIVVLMYSGRVVQRVGITNLMMLGAAAGIVRWTLLALSPPLWVVYVVQLLHAGTFCAVTWARCISCFARRRRISWGPRKASTSRS